MFKAARVVPLLISPITRGPCSLRPENRRDQLRPREAVSSVSADTWCCVPRSSPGSPHQHIRIVSWKWSQACVGKKTLDFKLVFFVWLVCMCVCVLCCCCCCCFSTCWRKAVLFKQSQVWYGWFTLTRRLCKGVYLRVSTFFPGKCCLPVSVTLTHFQGHRRLYSVMLTRTFSCFAWETT